MPRLAISSTSALSTAKSLNIIDALIHGIFNFNVSFRLTSFDLLTAFETLIR